MPEDRANLPRNMGQPVTRLGMSSMFIQAYA